MVRHPITTGTWHVTPDGAAYLADLDEQARLAALPQPCTDLAELHEAVAAWRADRAVYTMRDVAAAETSADVTLGTRIGPLTSGTRNVLWFRIVAARLRGDDLMLAEAELAAARHAAQDANDRYLTAIHTGQGGGIEADDHGEANVATERAGLALDIAAGRVQPGTVRFHRIDVSYDAGATWGRIGWGRSNALPGETAEAHAERVATESGITGQLMSPKPWRIQMWTDPRAGQAPDGQWSRHPVPALQLGAHVAEHGPIEIRTPDGWRPFLAVQPERYYQVTVRVAVDDGEWAYRMQGEDAVDIRSITTAPDDPHRIAPAAGQPRVTHGSWLRRFVGWQWHTREGWQTVVSARRNSVGRWFITTAESDGEWCEPDTFAIVRPAADPVDRLTRTQLQSGRYADCACPTWEDSGPFDPNRETTYARYSEPTCPTHQADTPASPEQADPEQADPEQAELELVVAELPPPNVPRTNPAFLPDGSPNPYMISDRPGFSTAASD